MSTNTINKVPLLDLRAQYDKRLGKTTLELSADIFNLFNDQATTRIEDLVAGTGTSKFGDDIAWRDPRRAFLGIRFKF